MVALGIFFLAFISDASINPVRSLEHVCSLASLESYGSIGVLLSLECRRNTCFVYQLDNWSLLYAHEIIITRNIWLLVNYNRLFSRRAINLSFGPSFWINPFTISDFDTCINSSDNDEFNYGSVSLSAPLACIWLLDQEDRATCEVFTQRFSSG